MSMEAQFYEARRRQSAIDRRQSFQMERDQQQSEYETVYIPVRVLRSTEKLPQCTCAAMIQYRPQLIRTESSLYRRDRDIYPRPRPIRMNPRRNNQYGSAILHHRFTSTEYRQQW